MNNEYDEWDYLQDSIAIQLKCPWCQEKVESSDRDSDYYTFECNKCRKTFRIDACETCGHPQCQCDPGYDDYEPCDGCKLNPISNRQYCQGGGCRG